MREWEAADIKFDVCASNSEDSNLFLRKFYEELFKEGTGGWLFQSYRRDNVIYVGRTNYGEMWFEYKERGKINRIYFKTYSEERHKRVENALKCAKQNHYNMKSYTITVIFRTDDLMFCDMQKNGIKINSVEKNGSVCTSVTFPVYAFGRYDLEYVQAQKINYLKHLLCAYTNLIFPCVSITCNEQTIAVIDNDWQEPVEDWMDLEEEFINYENKEISLRSEFFDIFRSIIDTFEYNREYRLLLNASQEIYICKKMLDGISKNGAEWNMPGYTDLINTLMISALEPLSNIYGVNPERCNECGNIRYSIRKKVRDLCNMYLPEYIAKEIYDKGYGDRSAFLHEGNPVTNEFYCGHCVPLINPADGRSIIFPTAYSNFNLFDYVTYIFRKVSSEVIKDTSNMG